MFTFIQLFVSIWAIAQNANSRSFFFYLWGKSNWKGYKNRKWNSKNNIPSLLCIFNVIVTVFLGQAAKREKFWPACRPVIFSERLASSIWMDWTSKKTCPVSILFVCARDISWACSLYTSDGSFSLFAYHYSPRRRTADVRSVGYAELFSLSREDVLTAMKDYPEAEVININLLTRIFDTIRKKGTFD